MSSVRPVIEFEPQIAIWTQLDRSGRGGSLYVTDEEGPEAVKATLVDAGYSIEVCEDWLSVASPQRLALMPQWQAIDGGGSGAFTSRVRIFEAERWAPLVSTPTLHEVVVRAVGLVEDISFYYQDGRREVSDFQVRAAETFLAVFTELGERAAAHVGRLPLDGPGFITGIANLCSQRPLITDRANGGNWLALVAGVERVTDQGVETARRGLDVDLGKPDAGRTILDSGNSGLGW